MYRPGGGIEIAADAGRSQPARVAVGLLRLIAEDGAEPEFAQLLADAAAADEPTRELAKLAGTVQTTMRRLRQHEAQLMALVDSATDLATVRDLDETLTAIVSRARRVLNVDVAYLSLIDEGADHTRLRVVDGAVTQAFRQLRMRIGDSLGGLVVESGMPITTSDYSSETQINHIESVDAAVTEEGLVSILAVPLLLRGRVIGVLYAGHRTQRGFSADEVAIACSLGAHAAVACENARLFQKMQASLTGLDKAAAVIREHSDQVAVAAHMQASLTGLLLRGGTLAALARVVSEALGGIRLIVVDQQGTVRAVAGQAEPYADQTMREAVHMARRSDRAIRHDNWYAAAIATPERDYGGVLAERDTDQMERDDLTLRALEYAALVMAVQQTVTTVAAETENRLRGDLVDDVLSNHEGSADTLYDRARLLGIDLDLEYAVVVATAERPDDLLYAATAWGSTHNGYLVGRHQGRTVLLVPGHEPGPAARLITTRLGQSAEQQVTAAASGPAQGPAGLRAAFGEASRCLESLIRLGAIGTGAAATDLGFVGLLLADQPDPRQFIVSTIGALLSYDMQRGAHLVATLREHLACDRNLAETARKLQIHVNTMRQRLDRIARLLGDDWQTSKRLLDIQLAIHLHDTVASLASE